VIGKLGYSNQWVYEKPASFLYLGLSAQKMAFSTLETGNFTTQFSSESFMLPSLEYFVRVARLASPESGGSLADLAFWSRYSLGGALRKGALSPHSGGLSDSSNTSSLLIGELRAAVGFSFERWDHFIPYIFGGGLAFGYRHSAPVDGAEAKATGFGYEASAGFHLPGLFVSRLAAYLEGRYAHVSQSSTPLLRSGAALSAGVGFTL
jgi:hypothetical protein